MRRSFLLLSIFLISVVCAWAQSEVGIRGGYNLSFASDSEQSSGGSPQSLYQGGLYAVFKLSDRFSIQPELIFSAQGYNYNFRAFKIASQGVSGDVQITGSDRMNYVTLPILLRANFGKMHLLLGPQFSYLVNQSSSCTVGVYYPGTDKLLPQGLLPSGENPYSDPNVYNNVDLAVLAGIGFDFGKLNIGLRYQYGMSDITKQEPARYRLSYTQSRSISIVLGYKLRSQKETTEMSIN